MPIANPLAYFMLVVWPLVAWVLFTKLDKRAALVWTILGGYMLLPPVIAIDLPVIPSFDKYSIPNLAAAAILFFALKERFGLWPENSLARALILLYVLSPFATVLTNTEPLVFQRDQVNGMRIYDSLAVVAEQFIALLPFFMARKFLASEDGLKIIIGALILAGLIYSIPMLYEARMSPQLNLRIYGYFQHDFSQAMRFGGFRPFVFMPHGLWVAFFALMSLTAALLALRIGPADRRPKQLLVALYLTVVLIFCRSAGPIVYAVVLAPMVLFFPRRAQLFFAALLALVVILYPLLRGLHLVPLQQILDFALSINQERGQSLAFRINSEELLLARAAEQPLFGWGGYGRNMLHDPITGQISVIADGGWIIVLGAYGWFGYLAEFGLLVLPVFFVFREGMAAPQLSPYLGALTLILAANLVDLLPNDTLIPFTWLLAGALLGHAEALAADRKARFSESLKVRYKAGRTVI